MVIAVHNKFHYNYALRREVEYLADSEYLVELAWCIQFQLVMGQRYAQFEVCPLLRLDTSVVKTMLVFIFASTHRQIQKIVDTSLKEKPAVIPP